MRVTRIPGDFNDIGERACHVYLNEVEVADWTVADDFRRVVETPEGARFGSVRIDLVPIICPGYPSTDPVLFVEGVEMIYSFRDGDLVETPVPPAPKPAAKPKKKRNR